MPKSAFEKALEKHSKDVAKSINKQIQADKRAADKQKREDQRRARAEALYMRAASVVNGQPCYGDIRIVDKTSQELISIICAEYKASDYFITNRDIDIPDYLQHDLKFEFEKLKQYGLISDYAYYINGCWEMRIYPSLLSYFEDKERAVAQEMQMANNTNNFYGDVTGVQIQQGAVNSSQHQTITQDFDFDLINDIIKNIKKYDSMFDNEFGDRASELRGKIEGIEELLEKKENPSKIKTLLAELKNLAIGVTGSLIASGIAAQIPMF